MNFELLAWFGNFINFLIFIFLSIYLVGSSCFSTFQLSLSLFGLLVSIFIQMVTITTKFFNLI
jgi:hypothetical protein